MENKERVFIPCEGKDFQNVEVGVVYDKGYWDWPRGYYVRVTGKNVSDDCSIEMWSSTWPSKRYLIQKVDRKNPKRFKELVNEVLSNAQEIAEKFLAEDYRAIQDYIPKM